MPAQLNDDIHRRLVQGFTAGAYHNDVAAYAGVPHPVLRAWLKRGRAYEDHLQSGGTIINGEDAYRLLAMECDQAQAEARISAVAQLRRAWQEGDWRAAAHFLERSDPANWARTQRVEMTGAEGGPMQIEVGEVERRLADSVQRAIEKVAPAAVETTEQAVSIPARGELESGEIADAELIEDVPDRTNPFAAVDAEIAAAEEDDDPYAWPTGGLDAFGS